MEPNPKYQLEGARGHVTRRDVLAALGVLALGGCVARTGGDVRESDVEAAQLLDDVIGVDMHSHAAGATGRRTPAYDLAARMRSGRMTAVCLQHTSDGPVIKRDPQNRIRVTREPDPGELWRFTQSRLAWFDNLVQSQGLRRALRRGDLEAAHREGAARASRTPLILSHTNLASRRLDPFTRLISGDHGKIVASTGGVVGIWASPTFTSLAGYVDGVTRAVETLWVDHVGFGTDNSG